MAPSEHISWMNKALALAQEQLGNTAPNPTVGCVIVKDDTLIGSGVTAKGGRPHAEVCAIESCKSDPLGTTMYVTLEPCCHQGQTPPCVDRIIASGIAHVVIAIEDPNPQVAGKGVQMLKDAGIQVTLGVGQENAYIQHRGFFHVIKNHRPMVSLKFATSKDGKIAGPNKSKQWITNQEARSYSNDLRRSFDAILVGVNTALIDDPMLTCKTDIGSSPIRIVLDKTYRLNKDSNLVKTSPDIPLWLVGDGNLPANLHPHITYLSCMYNNGNVDMSSLLTLLVKEGVTRLLVEGGAMVATSFWQSKLYDEIYWYQSPEILGDDAYPMLHDCPLSEFISSISPYHRLDVPLGNNSLSYYRVDP